MYREDTSTLTHSLNPNSTSFFFPSYSSFTPNTSYSAPLPSPSYPSHLPRPSAPSHTITWLFFYSSTSFSIFPFFSSFCSSSHFTLPCISFLLFLLIFFLLSPLFYICLLFLTLLFFPSPSCSFHLWSCHLFLRRPPPPSRSPGSPRRHSHLSLIFLLLPILFLLLLYLLPLFLYTPTVPQLQQAKSAARNLKRYVL